MRDRRRSGSEKLVGGAGLTARAACLALAAAGLAAFPATARAAPPNDAFANAAELVGTSATATGSNVGATVEPGEPSHGDHDPSGTVWWRWAAPAAGAFTVETCGSDVDTLLAVYTGADLASLSLVKANDDACDTESSVTFVAEPGQVYWIAVGGFDEGAVRLAVQPTLRVAARTVVRRKNVDATRFAIEVVRSDEDDTPRLTLVRGSTRVNLDLDLDNENEEDELSETSFRYTFEWLCSRSGRWRWTVAAVRVRERVTSEGTFAVPACRRQPWFVSRAKVAADFARDFDRWAARGLRCRAVGPTRRSLAHTWRCGLVLPGQVCTGSFVFRYSRVLQGRDVVSADRRAGGRASCRS